MPAKDLAVPIGLRRKDNLVYLNLHKKPQATVWSQGTTGSGKSETFSLISWALLSTSTPRCAFPSHRLQGWGEWPTPSKDLPRLGLSPTWMVPSLCGPWPLSMRRSIVRAPLWSIGLTISTNAKKFKLGEATDASSPLLDKWRVLAELRQPTDFIKIGLYRARVGRSLEVHLILATQKPSGVVGDQIWSNSRSKLARKVADRGDSMEMLRTAGRLVPQTSRLPQVRNSRIPQTLPNRLVRVRLLAWERSVRDQIHTIYLINRQANTEVLSQDLSGLDMAEENQEVPTELDVSCKKSPLTNKKASPGCGTTIVTITQKSGLRWMSWIKLYQSRSSKNGLLKRPD